jgi:hypothetical protein
MTKAPPDREIGIPVHRKPGAHDGYKCELCGDWIELRNLREVLRTKARYLVFQALPFAFPRGNKKTAIGIEIR